MRRGSARQRVTELEMALAQAGDVLRKHLNGRFHNVTLKTVTHIEQLLAGEVEKQSGR
jgi:hypothetical protein